MKDRKFPSAIAAKIQRTYTGEKLTRALDSPKRSQLQVGLMSDRVAVTAFTSASDRA